MNWVGDRTESIVAYSHRLAQTSMMTRNMPKMMAQSEVMPGGFENVVAGIYDLALFFVFRQPS